MQDTDQTMQSDLLYIAGSVPSDILQKKAAAMFKSRPTWCVWHTLIMLTRPVSGETDRDILKLWTLTRHETKFRCLVLLKLKYFVHFQTNLYLKMVHLGSWSITIQVKINVYFFLVSKFWIETQAIGISIYEKVGILIEEWHIWNLTYSSQRRLLCMNKKNPWCQRQ